ncbi:MAG: aminotransferase class V-fold PLP-dependent enzyme [Clostridia bacterium]|nr:aminotransferase class V-fold PLP-dependent enzyme [Clostridia bacterium]
MIYFDNAATTGRKPDTVISAVTNSLKKLSANPGRSGHKMSNDAAMTVYKAREKVSDFFGASGPENVVFTANCTHSINFVIKGVLKRGEHIIISDLEHNAVVRPLVTSDIDFSVATVSLTDDNVTVNNFEKLIKNNTRMVFCTGASNVIGKRLPIEKIGQMCKRRGILFGVDAAQTAGVVPIDMKKADIDFLCIAPHKGLYSPMGLGILIAEKPIPFTLIQGGTGTESINLIQPTSLPERFESGTVNMPAIAGLIAGIDFVKQKSTEKISDHEFQIVSYLYESMRKDKDFEVYTDGFDRYSYAPVLSFNVKGKPSGEVASYLDEKGIAVRAGLHCAPFAHKKIGTTENGTVRVCPSVYNTKNEADYMLNVFKSIKKL